MTPSQQQAGVILVRTSASQPAAWPPHVQPRRWYPLAWQPSVQGFSSSCTWPEHSPCDSFFTWQSDLSAAWDSLQSDAPLPPSQQGASEPNPEASAPPELRLVHALNRLGRLQDFETKYHT